VFAGSYDVNMILGDLSRDQIEQLWRTGQVDYGRFRIKYAKRKRFNILRRPEGHWFKQRPNGTWRPIWDASIMLWDVFGFFQASFVKSIEAWLGDSLPAEDLEVIRDMKAGRAQFQIGDIEEIRRYCDLELQWLVAMIKHVRDAHAEAGIPLQAFDGAGATAATMLRLRHVKSYIAELPPPVQLAAQHAYSGGRIEAVMIGNGESTPVHRYDINSAYPYIMSELPCLVHGQWSHNVPVTSEDFALVRLRWDRWDLTPPKADRNGDTPAMSVHGAPFYPYFFRAPNGAICYPCEGRGWYWACEMRPEEEAIETWKYSTECDCGRPLDWVTEMYEFRKELKRRGSSAEKAVKLGLNALYGKFAQQAGYATRGAVPTFHSLAWAGWITARTRARLYDAALQRPDSIIMFATDAVMSLEPLELSCSDALGDWDYALYDGITVAQSGVYWVREGNTWSDKYRGFDQGTLTREGIIEAWTGRESFTASLTRFIGMGSALSSEKSWPLWRTWQTMPRDLLIYPTGKRSERKKYNYSRGLYPTSPAFNNWNDELSTLYPLAWSEGSREEELIDGVPIKIVMDELEDSWS
jgi:hypothetical protein